MKKISLIACLLPLLGGCAHPVASDVGNRAETIVAELRNPVSEKVLVASHRGDWRNWPENSIPAIESAIAMGVDIIELDLKLTADSVLVLMHDKKIDRTTTGRGAVCDITYDSVRNVRLRAGQGIATHWRVPTFEEALEVCRDRAVVNIDQGFQYYDLIHPILERTGMLSQSLIKGRLTAREVDAVFSKYAENSLFMPIVNFSKPHLEEIVESYRMQTVPPLTYEVCWSAEDARVDAFMREVVDGGSKLWVNSLWPSLNAGYCDDAAAEGDVASIYGHLLDLGATVIQTDRPALLLSYLRTRGLHD